jgi:tripartite-type tricarboxylate transporter receptor subunit TctC
MNRFSCRTLIGVVLALAAGVFTSGALAQAFPTKPITIVAAYPPGGVADVVARVLATELGKRLGQPVVVENRVGAAGVIGATSVAKAAPDGHTLLMGAMAEMVFVPLMQDKGSAYQPDTQLAPVAMAVRYPFLFVTNPAFPAKTAKEIIDLARKNPDQYTYATAGQGSVQHIGMEMFTRMAGIKLRHIPYKGVAPALTDVLGNQVSMILAGFPPAIAHVNTGKLHAIGVTSKQRMSVSPNIPALAETPGMENYEYPVWVGLFAPAQTPSPILDRLHSEAAAIFALPEVRANLEKQGMTVSAESRGQFAAFVRSESKKYEKVIREGNITLAE